MSFKDILCRKIFCFLAKKIKTGYLTVTIPAENKLLKFGNPDSEPHADITILDQSFFVDAVTQGDWGMGWAYVRKKWDSPNIKNVCLIFMLNERILRPYIKLAMRLSPTMNKIRYEIANYQSSKLDMQAKTISQCYDIGDNFFKWMLGPSMTYTCAIWPNHDIPLEVAQENKFRLLCDKARIESHHRVLDIGCGYGALCNYIQKNTGAKVKGIALSHEHIAWSKKNYPQIEFEYLNYQNLTGMYDRIVSVEMAEHVGPENFDNFLKIISDHLNPGGRFVLHMMSSYEDILTLDEKERWTSFASVAMPNGNVTSIAKAVSSAIKTGTLRIIHTETLNIHYARTLLEWINNITKNKEEIINEFSEDIYRIYYYSWFMGLAALEAGFTLVQIIFEKKPYGSDYRESLYWR